LPATACLPTAGPVLPQLLPVHRFVTTPPCLHTAPPAVGLPFHRSRFAPHVSHLPLCHLRLHYLPQIYGACLPLLPRYHTVAISLRLYRSFSGHTRDYLTTDYHLVHPVTHYGFRSACYGLLTTAGATGSTALPLRGSYLVHLPVLPPAVRWDGHHTVTNTFTTMVSCVLPLPPRTACGSATACTRHLHCGFYSRTGARAHSYSHYRSCSGVTTWSSPAILGATVPACRFWTAAGVMASPPVPAVPAFCLGCLPLGSHDFGLHLPACLPPGFCSCHLPLSLPFCLFSQFLTCHTTYHHCYHLHCVTTCTPAGFSYTARCRFCRLEFHTGLPYLAVYHAGATTRLPACGPRTTAVPLPLLHSWTLPQLPAVSPALDWDGSLPACHTTILPQDFTTLPHLPPIPACEQLHAALLHLVVRSTFSAAGYLYCTVYCHTTCRTYRTCTTTATPATACAAPAAPSHLLPRVRRFAWLGPVRQHLAITRYCLPPPPAPPYNGCCRAAGIPFYRVAHRRAYRATCRTL